MTSPDPRAVVAAIDRYFPGAAHERPFRIEHNHSASLRDILRALDGFDDGSFPPDWADRDLFDACREATRDVLLHWQSGRDLRRAPALTAIAGFGDANPMSHLRRILSTLGTTTPGTTVTHPASPSSAQSDASECLRLFISHSSRDTALVAALVELLKTALRLRAVEIRCTSVDGYRLPGGADTENQLRKEAQAADAFIGVISPNSIRSLYVVFELGARWGTGKHLLPLLAPGTPTSVMQGPLAAINALHCTHADLHQLVTDVAATLEMRHEPASSYQKYLDAIIALPQARAGSAVLPEAGSAETFMMHGLRWIRDAVTGANVPICSRCFPKVAPLNDRGAGYWGCRACHLGEPTGGGGRVQLTEEQLKQATDVSWPP